MCVSEWRVYLPIARPLLQEATSKRGGLNLPSASTPTYKTYLSGLEADSLESCSAQVGLVGIVGQPYHQPVQWDQPHYIVQPTVKYIWFTSKCQLVCCKIWPCRAWEILYSHLMSSAPGTLHMVASFPSQWKFILLLPLPESWQSNFRILPHDNSKTQLHHTLNFTVTPINFHSDCLIVLV